MHLHLVCYLLTHQFVSSRPNLWPISGIQDSADDAVGAYFLSLVFLALLRPALIDYLDAPHET
jgi:hypothetical protein